MSTPTNDGGPAFPQGQAMKTRKGHDVLQREIFAGDYIVYGAAKGRCAGLNIGHVLEVKAGKYVCDAIDVSFGKYHRTGMAWGYSKNKKPRKVTLLYSERICVINDMPEEFKIMLS